MGAANHYHDHHGFDNRDYRHHYWHEHYGNYRYHW